MRLLRFRRLGAQMDPKKVARIHRNISISEQRKIQVISSTPAKARQKPLLYSIPATSI